MFRFFDKPVYVLPSVTGRVAWVDYIPVQESSGAGRRDSYDTNGSLNSTTVLSSVSGLVAWIDYTPIYNEGTVAWVDHILVDEDTESALLMETGDILLLETGDQLLL